MHESAIFRTMYAMFQDNAMDKAASVLRAVTNAERIQILNYIDHCREAQVHSIYTELGINQSIASQQLRVLRDNGLVLIRKEGKQVFYRINYAMAEQIQKGILALQA